MKFEDELAALVARELPHARRDPDRLAGMIERLGNSLSLVIAVACRGKAADASILLDGVSNHLDESVAEQLPFGRLLA